jgi:hypothetical protein
MPNHNDAFLSSWYKFKNFILVEIGLLLSQPYTNSHFHFFITVQLAAPQALPFVAVTPLPPL